MVPTSLQTLDVGGTARVQAQAATANTIAARNSSGDIYAQVFHGIATQAQYADLAEKYTADKEYEPRYCVSIWRRSRSYRMYSIL